MNIGKEIALLQQMTVLELRAKFDDVFGEPTNANNKAWLVKRIAWRMQAVAGGTLSERARQRAAALANDADVRLSAPKAKPAPAQTKDGGATVLAFNGDSRVPPPGSVITRIYKGVKAEVTVLNDGFEYHGERFKSLSAVAKVITGSHCNGFAFFELAKEGKR
ncbi:MAG TPA: DUF2924 domain-containing protein [Pirellulales bacterium]|nr:DUF2924 domain-containing protein [Pirellulales bacterium]